MLQTSSNYCKLTLGYMRLYTIFLFSFLCALSVPQSSLSAQKLEPEPRDKLYESVVFSSYLDLSTSLADDDYKGAIKHYNTFVSSTKKADEASGLDKSRLKALTQTIPTTVPKDIKSLRKEFVGISKVFTSFVAFKELPKGIKKASCPMADDFKGAMWLQKDKRKIHNPYFGAEMLNCGKWEK